MRVAIASLLFTASLALAAAAPIQVAVPAPESKPGTRPEWLTALIAKLDSEPVANPPASITRFDYRGQPVYYLPPRCCDVPSTLYDATGAVICSPDGGFSGRGDGRCADFFTERTNERSVWRDTRKQRF
jgi:hypothetical protein